MPCTRLLRCFVTIARQDPEFETWPLAGPSIHSTFTRPQSRPRLCHGCIAGSTNPSADGVTTQGGAEHARIPRHREHDAIAISFFGYQPVGISCQGGDVLGGGVAVGVALLPSRCMLCRVAVVSSVLTPPIHQDPNAALAAARPTGVPLLNLNSLKSQGSKNSVRRIAMSARSGPLSPRVISPRASSPRRGRKAATKKEEYPGDMAPHPKTVTENRIFEEKVSEVNRLDQQRALAEEQRCVQTRV